LTGSTDEQLMSAVKSGNLDQLNELCLRYQKRVFNYMLKSTLNADDSADLAQNVFIRVLKYRNSYREGNSFEQWVFQIARNLLKDHFNKMKVYQDRFDLVEQLPEAKELLDEEQLEREQKLMQALNQLPEEKRELLVLSKFEGMKYEQIAAMRETSVSAIKVQVHRTIKQLKEIYFDLKT